MGGPPVGERARASTPRQSRSQPSRLCQACLSVLARDDLELTKLYPHHENLKDFVEASRASCYICSWLFAATFRFKERLGLVAEGQIPEYALEEEAQIVDRVVSYPRAELRDYIQNKGPAKVGEAWDNSMSWVSFTGMKLRPGVGKQIEIVLLLNPLYEGYFPLPTTIYDSWLREMWEHVARYMFHIRPDFPIIFTHQDFLELGLMADELPSNTGSMAAWTTVAGWVRQCSEKHQCMAQVASHWYPTRLVEIISDESIRIVRSDSKDFQPKGGYVTLSHRWGDGEFVKLTKSQALTSSFPVRMLRKTFQDAIVVAQRMAVPYIWIDSLCIIQCGDDGTDWREESANMAQVYSNSFCNIAADWGNESDGLFFERTGSIESPCKLHMRWSLRSLESRQAVNVPSLPPNGGLCHITHPSGWSENVMKSPLNQRAWVLQERQLSSRILHFSPEGVSWECREKTSWERAPLGFSDQDHASSWGLIECASTLSGMRRLRFNEPDIPFDWPRLVDEYTRCGLTKQSDKLVAIAGIAKMLARIVKDQYVAGLWSKELPYGLVWRSFLETSSSLTKSSRPTKSYFSPSFSWAAAEGPVSTTYFRWDKILPNTSATFVQHRKEPSSSVICKNVRAKLSGQLLSDDVFVPVTYPEVEVRMEGMLRSCRRVPPRLVPDGWIKNAVCPSADTEYSEISSCFEKGTACSVSYDRATEEDVPPDSMMYYYTMVSYRVSYSSQSSASSRCIDSHGILLKSVDSRMGRFERVGHVEHSGEHNGGLESIYPPLGNERDLPAWSYDETTGQHTFYII